jgi:quercetin dioxygenase-like cupin family protein
MTIQNYQIKKSHVVRKPWGQETWIQPGSEVHDYSLKEIIINQGVRTSIQVHQFKAETAYILEGTGELWYGPEFFDCAAYTAGKLSTEQIKEILDNLQVTTYGPGSVLHIEPGTIHCMVALTDLRFIETSTRHLDDVFRLQDDANRTHGKIDTEHVTG